MADARSGSTGGGGGSGGDGGDSNLWVHAGRLLSDCLEWIFLGAATVVGIVTAVEAVENTYRRILVVSQSIMDHWEILRGRNPEGGAGRPPAQGDDQAPAQGGAAGDNQPPPQGGAAAAAAAAGGDVFVVLILNP